MKKYSFFTILMGLLCLAQSCKVTIEDINDNSLPFAGKRLQMSGFILSPAVDFDGDGVVDADLMKYIPACSLDDAMIFEKNGKLSGDGGKIHCTDEKLPAVDAHWSYDKSTKKLRMVNGSNINEWTVVTMSGNQLTVQAPLVNNGISHNAVLTMVAQ
jgi:hypothetical protein